MTAGSKTNRTSSEARDDFLAPSDHAPYKLHGIECWDAVGKERPQNWTPRKKRLLFAALISSSLLADGYDTCSKVA